jgi:hypothetical protein
MCQTQYQLHAHYQPYLGFSQICRIDNNNKKENKMERSKKLLKPERNENSCEHAAIS